MINFKDMTWAEMQEYKNMVSVQQKQKSKEAAAAEAKRQEAILDEIKKNTDPTVYQK